MLNVEFCEGLLKFICSLPSCHYRQGHWFVRPMPGFPVDQSVSRVFLVPSEHSGRTCGCLAGNAIVYARQLGIPLQEHVAVGDEAARLMGVDPLCPMFDGSEWSSLFGWLGEVDDLPTFEAKILAKLELAVKRGYCDCGRCKIPVVETPVAQPTLEEKAIPVEVAVEA